MVSDVLKNAIADVENEKVQKLAGIREQVMREKIIPYNQEIDESCAKAIAQLQAETSEEMRMIQEKFEDKRRSLIEAGNKKKKEYEETTISIATSNYTQECDRVITLLRKGIEDQNLRNGVL